MKKILITLVIMTMLIAAFSGVVKAQGYIEMDPIVVEGQIQRPEAAYIIQRANLEFGMQAKKRSFISKVEQSIETDPF